MSNRSRHILGIFIMEEIWKDIEGYEGFYQVSNKGRIKTLYYNHSKNRNEKILKLCKDQKDYLLVNLTKYNVRKTLRIARLVAQTFIPNPENKPQINHKNGIKADNRVENLEWCTCKDNIRHAFKNGLNKSYQGKGVNSNYHKLTQIQVNNIRKECKYKLQRKIAKKYNITQSNISSIVNYKTW